MRTLAAVLALPLAGSLVPRAAPLRRRSAARASTTMLVGAPAPSDAGEAVAARSARRNDAAFAKLLGADAVDMDALRSLAWNGVPGPPRGRVRRFLLGVLAPSAGRPPGGAGARPPAPRGPPPTAAQARPPPKAPSAAAGAAGAATCRPAQGRPALGGVGGAGPSPS